MVYILHKTIYGLKQAPRAWNQNIDSYLLETGFTRSKNEPTLYIKTMEKELILLSLYVDDLIITGTSSSYICKFKEEMKTRYKMTYLGILKFFLGLQIKHLTCRIFISQELYTRSLLKKYKMVECNPITTPMSTGEKLMPRKNGEVAADIEQLRSMTGSFIYLTNTRPNIENAVNILSRFVSNSSTIHFSSRKKDSSLFVGDNDLWYLLQEGEERRADLVFRLRLGQKP